MSTHTAPPPLSAAAAEPSVGADRAAQHAAAGHQAYLLLRLAFTIAPIAFGLDKFFNILVDWTQYLAPWINDIVPGNADQAMYAVGVIEIFAGLVADLQPEPGRCCVRLRPAVPN